MNPKTKVGTLPVERESPSKIHLQGLDFVRALAAFGVVVMHSNFGQRARMTCFAETFSGAFVFAVPFFLATSLYFRAERDRESWAELGHRLKRLSIPYLLWSGIYLAAHGAKLLLLGPTEMIPGFLLRIPEHLLCGSSAVHLYFLPLLAVGSVLLFSVRIWLIRSPIAVLVGALLFACAASGVMRTGMHPADSLPVWQKAVHNSGYWACRVLPVTIAAVLVARFLPRQRLASLPKWITALTVLVIALPQLLGLTLVPPGAWDVWIGFGWFLLGCGLGRWLPQSKALQAVGAASGGIFLVHHLVVETIQTTMEKVVNHWTQETTLPTLLAISLIAFLSSYFIVSFASRHSPLVRRLFVI